jgi:hypothetical protein
MKPIEYGEIYPLPKKVENANLQYSFHRCRIPRPVKVVKELDLDTVKPLNLKDLKS